MTGIRKGFFRAAVTIMAFALPAFDVATLPAAAQVPAGFALHDNPQPVPEIQFENGRGEATSLADFRGKVVLLNIWATWCAPCRREMPTLDRLQAQLGGPEFEVVALSIDSQGLPAVREFYDEIGLDTLPLYIDRSGSAQRSLRVLGIPTTLLLDRDGNEIGRLAGPAEWDSPEMVTFIRSHVERQSGGAPDPLRDQRQVASVQNRPAAAGRRHRSEEPFPSSAWKDPYVMWMRRY